MIDTIRALFDKTLIIDMDYGLCRLQIGRSELILTPESVRALVDILAYEDDPFNGIEEELE